MGLGILVAVILLLVALSFCLILVLKNQLRSCAKRVGKRVAGVEVDYDSVSFDFCRAWTRLEIHGLAVFNPAGYSTEEPRQGNNSPQQAHKLHEAQNYALRVDRLILDLDLCSWIASLGEVIDIKRLVLEELDLHMELNQTGGSNLQDILKHLDKYNDEQQEEEGDLENDSLVACTANPYAKGGVDANAIVCIPRFDCWRSRGEVKVHSIEAKTILGQWENNSLGLGGNFQVADLNIDDFERKTRVTRYDHVACALLQTVIVATLETVPEVAPPPSHAKSRLCWGSPDLIRPASPESAWSAAKGRWILAPDPVKGCA